MKTKVVAKMVIKTIRQITESEYYNYEILHSNAG